MSTLVDLRGRRFGRLRVIHRAEGNAPGGVARWAVLCDCGTEKVVRSRSLISGDTRSCGCLHRERARQRGEANRLEVVGYDAVHRRMRLEDSATNYTCVDCHHAAHEWSYDRTNPDPNEMTDPKGRPYSLDPAHYVARCRSCHRKHDAHQPPTSA